MNLIGKQRTTCIEDWNRLHPIGATVWIEDGSEHRRRGVVIESATERVVVVALLEESENIPPIRGSQSKLDAMFLYAQANGSSVLCEIGDVRWNSEYP